MKTTLKKQVIVVIGVLFILGIAGFLASIHSINTSISSKCDEAISQYNRDCVDSLILLLDDESNSFRLRNNAIWALGQIGDERALPVLQKYYTGVIPNKESLNEGLSQYELKKALSYFQGSPNITRYFR